MPAWCATIAGSIALMRWPAWVWTIAGVVDLAASPACVAAVFASAIAVGRSPMFIGVPLKLSSTCPMWVCAVAPCPASDTPHAPNMRSEIPRVIEVIERTVHLLREMWETFDAALWLCQMPHHSAAVADLIARSFVHGEVIERLSLIGPLLRTVVARDDFPVTHVLVGRFGLQHGPVVQAVAGARRLVRLLVVVEGIQRHALRIREDAIGHFHRSRHRRRLCDGVRA